MRPAALAGAPAAATDLHHAAEPGPAPAAAQPAPEAMVSRDSGVTIAPFSPAPAAYTTGELDVEMEVQAEAEHTPAEAPFIPPVAETPPSRMPRVEDFPPVVQRQIEARQAREEDRGPLSLLRRLPAWAPAEEGSARTTDPAAQRQQPSPRLQPRVRTPHRRRPVNAEAAAGAHAPTPVAL
jgi:cell division protein FtsZ